MDAEHFVDEAAVGLSRGDEIDFCIGVDADFDAVFEKKSDETSGGDGIALVFDGNAPADLRVGGLNGLRGHRGYTAEKFLAKFADDFESGTGGDELVVHDVAQAPEAAGPWIGEIDLLLVGD